MTKRLCVVILQHESADLTLRLLESVVAKEREHLEEYRVVVLDNGSTESWREEIEGGFPFVEFHAFESNLGFAGAHNRLLPSIEEPWVLLINNDCELVNDAIHRTLEGCRERRADFGTCRLLNPDGSNQGNWSFLPSPLRHVFFGVTRLAGLWRRMQLRLASGRVGYVNGAFLMLRMSTFRAVGYFDDSHFMYAEDLDLMFKLREVGARGFQFRGGTVIHLGGGSAARSWSDSSIADRKKREGLKCIARHFPRWQVKLWGWVTGANVGDDVWEEGNE